MKLFSQILTVIAAILLAIFIVNGRLKGYGSWEAGDATAVAMLAIAIRLTFAGAPDERVTKED